MQVAENIVGIDEVGRGPVAGPVSVCALKFKIKNSKLKIRKAEHKLKIKLRDSKKLTPSQREKWFGVIKEWTDEGYLSYAVVSVSSKIIDTIGINNAIQKAMDKALINVNAKSFDALLLDGGLRAPSEFRNQKTIIKGDEKESIIALASICAKVSRDKYMCHISKQFPMYVLYKNKGYGTPEHMDALNKYGLSKIHRKSFLKMFKK